MSTMARPANAIMAANRFGTLQCASKRRNPTSARSSLAILAGSPSAAETSSSLRPDASDSAKWAA